MIPILLFYVPLYVGSRNSKNHCSSHWAFKRQRRALASSSSELSTKLPRPSLILPLASLSEPHVVRLNVVVDDDCEDIGTIWTGENREGGGGGEITQKNRLNSWAIIISFLIE